MLDSEDCNATGQPECCWGWACATVVGGLLGIFACCGFVHGTRVVCLMTWNLQQAWVT